MKKDKLKGETAFLSHAMIVQGKIQDKVFSNIVIDPGASKSLIDKKAAKKLGVDILSKSKYVIQMANDQIEQPVGEFA